MPECRVRGKGKMCAPLNHVVMGTAPDDLNTTYSACACGRRYSMPPGTRRRLQAYFDPDLLVRRGDGTLKGKALDELIKRSLWPASSKARFAKEGIVPVGTPVLHAPADAVTAITNELKALGNHMLSVMRRADGIGLAANQVGVPLRVLVHKLESVAPTVLLNAGILKSEGTWLYSEGCLSLHMDNTRALVRRPGVITIRATTLDGLGIVLKADELFSRVLQHEIDHLAGIEYVQRLTEEDLPTVYQVIADNGIDISCIPPKPY